jgi:hypothetical protein
MSAPFLAINSNAGRIGRLCWTNSDTRGDRFYNSGNPSWPWWGWCHINLPHPARQGEAW